MKETVRFQQTLDKKTLDFLVEWYELPIQDIVRTLATIDKTEKEKQKQ